MTSAAIGTRLVPDADTTSFDDGQLLVGGAPRRVLKLTDRGARLARDLLAGGPVTDSAGAALARRLLRAGLAHPLPADVVTYGLEIVVPTFGARHLDECLTALGNSYRVHVVDDGSADGDEVSAIAQKHGARLTRLHANRGPAAARNVGLRAATEPFVAFVDSDANVTSDALRRLTTYFTDPLVAAVAPRVRPLATSSSSRLARFAAADSPLDLGSRPALVQATGRVGHVPTTVLVVRRCALEDVGGFDETMRYGEDVDLVWRLAHAGKDVRYQPDVVAHHVEPTSWSEWLRRRARYGTSAGALDVRQPAVAVALRPPALPVAALASFVARRDRLAAGFLAVTMARQWSKWRRAELPSRAVAPVVATDTLRGVVACSGWLTQIWLPLILLLSRRRILRASLVVLAPAMLDWSARRPALDPATWAVATIADDAAYGAGVWRGCLRARTWRPLVTRSIRQ